ncbi:hypothetical protein NIES2101_41260 [Calothrix sp. HK-06]|nr:hypothetical protein NIES2101_41260 [Calothrix sp. HK-06]
MAENVRVRIECDIEEYLKSQSQRVLGKSSESITGADLSTLANRLIYEHKQAWKIVERMPFERLLSWVINLIPGARVVSFTDKSVLYSPAKDSSTDQLKEAA